MWTVPDRGGDQKWCKRTYPPPPPPHFVALFPLFRKRLPAKKEPLHRHAEPHVLDMLKFQNIIILDLKVKDSPLYLDLKR